MAVYLVRRIQMYFFFSASKLNYRVVLFTPWTLSLSWGLHLLRDFFLLGCGNKYARVCKWNKTQITEAGNGDSCGYGICNMIWVIFLAFHLLGFRYRGDKMGISLRLQVQIAPARRRWRRGKRAGEAQISDAFGCKCLPPFCFLLQP